ncbi:hypothetical protein SG34_009310 [Thalassomonas viridans]|uniref:Uncharacterized protein n=1 Tax=Thalassomonas viridans TaxID=137584 RepID=A0AAF0CAN6_9GAMM|nr:hypothetical protein [Thalassomonas viridans]WDE07063.1 hypothetical protein SG34_009310 [Thalassomonas viridans]
MKFNLRKNAASILFELLTVTLGVFIALAINSWYESYQNKQKSYDLLQRIEQELVFNQPKIIELEARILKSITQVENHSDALELALEQNKDLLEQEPFELFYQVLHFDVWQLSQNRNETNELPVDLIADIGKAYRYSQALSDSNRHYIEVFNDLTHQYRYNADTLAEKLASSELIENKLLSFKIDMLLAKITNESALEAIYEYAPDIKKKRDKLEAENKEKQVTPLLSEKSDNPGQVGGS